MSGLTEVRSSGGHKLPDKILEYTNLNTKLNKMMGSLYFIEILFFPLRACLEAGFESEKSQFFDETRRLFTERTLRYGQKKQRSIIKKVAFAAQRLASKQALSPALS